MKPQKLFPDILNRKPFLHQDHPVLHPVEDEDEYLAYWLEVEKRCIEGFWVEETKGKFRFMPPQLYFYINVCMIIDEDEETNSTIESPPILRDLDWVMGTDYFTCRGFSGYVDSDFTCNDLIRKIELGKKLSGKEKIRLEKFKHVKLPNGEYKKYLDPLECLRQTHSKPLGAPVYENNAKNYILFGSRGGGKATPLTTPVLTPLGWKQMGDLRVGDQVIGRDGKPCNILQIHPQGMKEVFKVKLQDGREAECCEDHLWTVMKADRKEKVISTKEMLNNGLSYYAKKGDIYKYRIPNCKPIEFEEKELPVDPYILGALLGDGTMTTLTPKIASSDEFIIEEFKRRLPGFEFKYDESTTNNYTIVDIDKEKIELTSKLGNKYLQTGGNRLTKAIKELGLNQTCVNKFIPEEYKFGSINQRLELVRGLMDTDGSINNNGCSEFTNTNLTLIKDLADVLRSLGIRCEIGEDKREGQPHEIKGHACLRTKYYRLFINTNKEIFKLPRKLERLKLKKDNNSQDFIPIIEIEKTGINVEQQCITVDSIDNTYITNDYIVTHNSFFVASCLNHEWYFSGIKSHDILLKEKPSPIELLLAAGSSDFSNDLMTKIKLTQDYIQSNVGAYTDKTSLEEVFYPGFFHKESSGSTTAGAKVPLTQKFGRKRGNSWLVSGIGTTLSHKTITTENPNVASGKRNNLQVVEEGGLVGNIFDFYGTAKNSMIRKNKFGTLFIIGTSGNMDKLDGIKKMFENPDEYDFLSFNDVYEGRDKRIGRFLPAYYADEDFRDKNGNTNVEASFEHVMEVRAGLALSDTSSLLDNEMMNRPIVPSEMFMNKAGLKFPVVKIRARKTELDLYKFHEKIWSIGTLEYTDKDKNQVKWKPDLERKLKPILTYNLDQYNHDYTSGIVIYEHPPSIIPDPTYKRSLYKITYDPVKDDKGGTSLCSILVYKGFSSNLWEAGFQDTIVAEYVGRLDKVNDMHEIAIKLAHYYNAKILPETNISDMIRYCEMVGKYNMLQPALTVAIGKILKNPSFKYEVGIDMTSKTLQEQSIQLLRQWLLNPRKVNEFGIVTETNIDHQYSLRLLNELEIFNGEGNYDHLRSAMILALWMSQETEEPIEEAANNRKYEEIDEFFLQRDKQINNDFYYQY